MTLPRLSRIVLSFSVVALPLVLSACSDLTGPGGSLRSAQRDLTRARRDWRSNSFIDYEYVVARDCYCAMSGIGVRVTVRNGYVFALEVDATGEPLPLTMTREYPSIDGLFTVIQHAIDTRAWEVDARYDVRYGFPTDVWIDYDRRMADEEEGYRLIRFRSLR